MSFWDDVKRGWRWGRSRASPRGDTVSFFSARALFSSPVARGGKHPDDLKETIKLQAEVQALWEASPLVGLDLDDVIIDIIGGALNLGDQDYATTEDVSLAFIDVTQELLFREGLTGVPDPDWSKELTLTEGVKLRHHLYAQRRFLTNYQRYFEIWTTKLHYLYAGIFSYLPDDCFVSDDENVTNEALFTVSLASKVTGLDECIERIIATFADDDVRDLDLFDHVQTQLYRNIVTASGMNPELPETHKKPFIGPTSFKESYPDEIVTTYLAGTPFEALFTTRVPFVIPQHIRFEHMWVVSPPGTGKTTMLQAFIQKDLQTVARGDASLIVMESNRDLFKSIERLKIFGKGEPLEDKLVLVDVEDVDHPIALNLFDLGLGNFNTSSSRDREVLRNATTAMLDYIFRSLLGAELTSRQSTLFNFTIQLLLEVPHATLDTLIEIMQADDLHQFGQYIDHLDVDGRKFFQDRFFNRQYLRTKSEIIDRIYAIKRNRVLSNMFSAETTKLNLFNEMGAGKVILVNAAKSLLQEEGVELFGRFFLALVLLAAEQRQLLPKSERLPVFFYMDEAQDFIRRDEKLPVMLDQARKLNVGISVAHQRLEQMNQEVLHALFGSTAIKFASNLSDHNANLMAKNMRTTTEFIARQPKYSFAAYVRDVTDAAVSLEIPFVDFNQLPKMSDEE